jgi:hypothetical protein
MRIVLTAFIIASIVVYLGIRDNTSILFKLMVMLPFVLVGAGLVYFRRKDEYDDRATDIIGVDRKADSITKPFVLFLRPFQLDKIEADNPRISSMASMFVPFYRMMQPSTVSIDDAIRFAIPDSLELIAVSKNEDLGAIKLESDDNNWTDMVTSLALSARIIIIIPGNRPGTIWEMQRIRELGLLQKCLFILTPSPLMMALPEISFDQVKAAFNAAEINLPNQFNDSPVEACDAVIFNNLGQLTLHQKGVLDQGFLFLGVKVKKIRKLFEATNH